MSKAATVFASSSEEAFQVIRRGAQRERAYHQDQFSVSRQHLDEIERVWSE
jgi:hypothetical protein